MTQKEIIERNVLIAEFMGIKDSENRYSHESSEYYFEACELLFHYSWDWLMSVVEKIESLGCIVEVSFSIATICRIYSVRHRVNFTTENNISISAVYDAVIDYIKWYNSTEFSLNKQQNDKTESSHKEENKTPCKPRIPHYPPGEADYL